MLLIWTSKSVAIPLGRYTLILMPISNVDTSDFLRLVSNSTGTPAFIFYHVLYLPKITNEVAFESCWMGSLSLDCVPYSALHTMARSRSGISRILSLLAWGFTVDEIERNKISPSCVSRNVFSSVVPKSYLDWIAWNSFSSTSRDPRCLYTSRTSFLIILWLRIHGPGCESLFDTGCWLGPLTLFVPFAHPSWENMCFGRLLDQGIYVSDLLLLSDI